MSKNNIGIEIKQSKTSKFSIQERLKVITTKGLEPKKTFITKPIITIESSDEESCDHHHSSHSFSSHESEKPQPTLQIKRTISLKKRESESPQKKGI